MKRKVMLVRMLGLCAVFSGIVAAFAGCGGDDTSGSGGTGATGGSGGSSTQSSSSGMGGAGGSSTQSNSSGTGGTGGGEPTLNGCTVSGAEDHTADMSVTITTMGLSYTPKCVRIKAGSSAVFNVDFGLHPLSGGEVNGGVASPDPTSPIQMTMMGMTATFTFPNAGDYPYYCTLHGVSAGMTGVIYVE